MILEVRILVTFGNGGPCSDWRKFEGGFWDKGNNTT